MSNLAITPDSLTETSSNPALAPGFVDRRKGASESRGMERRQFGNSYRNLSQAGQELAEAIDAYKVENRRRYITTDEMLHVIQALGYEKTR